MEQTIGEITLFAGNFAPRGWAFCDGQLLAISQHDALFSILGTTYGGDGRTTFALPDFRGRAPVSQGTGNGLSSYRLGEKTGQADVYMNTLNLPSHTHNTQISGTLLMPSGSSADTDDPSGAYPGTPAGNNIYGSPATASTMGALQGQFNLNLQPSGSNQAINNTQPSLVLHYIIALIGVYPSRS